jgi:hypothetical protein
MEIEVYTVEEFQERWDEMIERVENDSGETAVMVPIEDSLYQLYTDHDEAS